MHDNNDINGYVWLCAWDQRCIVKWISASRILCNHKIVLKLKGKFYRMVVWAEMVYGSASAVKNMFRNRVWQKMK